MFRSGLWPKSLGYPEFLQDLWTPLSDGFRRMTKQRRELRDRGVAGLVEAIIDARAESVTLALSEDLLDRYEMLDDAGRMDFFQLLVDRFGISADEVVAAAHQYQASPSQETLKRLYDAAEPARQNLIRRLNQAREGTARLVRMREDLLRFLPKKPQLGQVDLDFLHLFQSWFSGGFLELRRIDWNTPASVLAKIIEYEAVHEIRGWDDLRGRIDPPDRRLYAFFHPRLPLDPLVFIEIALADETPSSIGSIIDNNRAVSDPRRATVAVFYSISNCHVGLRGVSFGNLLIKQVVATLGAELARLKTFVTLSPAPGFARWIKTQEGAAAILDQVSVSGWAETQDGEKTGEDLRTLAATYLMQAKDKSGAPLDPVARFHLGNGARLDRINWPGNLSPAGLEGAHGVMVNYLYKLDQIENWSESFFNDNRVVAAPPVAALAARPLHVSRD